MELLIDSGSSSSFINESLVPLLHNIQTFPVFSSVQVARGGMLSSPLVLQQVPWTVDDYTFHSVFWVLSLTAFDLVIDMDWLEAYS